VVQVYGQAWTKPRAGTLDLDATVHRIAAVLARCGVARVYGDRLTDQWIVEAFKRHGVEYVHPTLRGQGAPVYVTRSLGCLEAGVLFRTGAVKILEDPVTCWELCNLEQRGDEVDHPAGYHDDRANVLGLATVMAAEGRRRDTFDLVEAITTSTTGEIFFPRHRPWNGGRSPNRVRLQTASGFTCREFCRDRIDVA